MDKFGRRNVCLYRFFLSLIFMQFPHSAQKCTTEIFGAAQRKETRIQNTHTSSYLRILLQHFSSVWSTNFCKSRRNFIPQTKILLIFMLEQRMSFLKTKNRYFLRLLLSLIRIEPKIFASIHLQRRKLHFSRSPSKQNQPSPLSVLKSYEFLGYRVF